MEQLLETSPAASEHTVGIPHWRNPAAWLLNKKLSRKFWAFFAVAFLFDFGFSIYIFLFNLFLLDYHFNERVIGLVGGAFTLGSVAGTLPAGWMSRKIGLQPMLVLCLVSAPLLGVARTALMWEAAQIVLAFLAGLAICVWGVCFLPTVARFTTDDNRATAFSLIFSVGIGTSALGGLACGYLPQWLRAAGHAMSAADTKRLILLAACVLAMLGLIPLARLTIPLQQTEPANRHQIPRSRLKVDPFLLRFLPSMALWTAVLAAFTPFANVYLLKNLQVPLVQIGLIFSVSQIIQLCVGLLTPLIFRRLGLINGIVATQVATATAIGCLAVTHDRAMAVALYLSFSAAQWMSSPGLYNLLMSRVPDAERSSASAMTLFCNALLQSCATVGAGILFAQFGYPRILAGIAGLALMAAALFATIVASAERTVSQHP